MFRHVNELVVAIVTMLGSLATIYLKYLLDEKKKNAKEVDPVQKHYDGSRLINAKLQEVLETLDADRAYIVQYHNGSYYKSGESMLKISMTHEVTCPGISREIANAQNIPAGLFGDALRRYYEDGCFLVEDTTSDDMDAAMRQLYQSRGVKSVYAFPIRALNNNIVGSIMVNYVTEKATLSQAQLEYLLTTASQVSGYLRAAGKK